MTEIITQSPPKSESKLCAATAFRAISAGLVSYTYFEFMLEAVRDDFAMSADETMIVAFLLVVFLVGELADRFGDQRTLNATCPHTGAVSNSCLPSLLVEQR